MAYTQTPGATGSLAAGGEYDNLDTVDSISYSSLSAESAAASALSAAAALASQTAAATSATNAATSASNSASSAAAASSSATSAGTSASTATTQAGIATTQASNAASSASAAATSASNASSSASSASASASTATTQAGIATTQASNASTSASNAATSETNAANSATSAAASAVTAAGYIPSLTGNSGKFLTNNGTAASWITLTGTLAYQGNWNATTNTPALTSSVGTNGYYYIVSVSGSTNLNGITDWVVGDWAIFNGSVWQKIDQTNLVTSVAGRTGAVTLANTDISGLGTMSTQAASNVAITGGSITGITDLAVADGGTGASTAQGAINTLAGAVTSGSYLRGNGTNVTMSAIQAADVPTLNQNTTGSAATLTTGRTIAVTGDISYTSPSFNGSANVTAAGTLATVNANVGSFTNATVTVNAKGLVTAASNGSAVVTSVTGTSPINSSGGTTPTISLASAYGDTINPYGSKTANYVLASPNGSAGAPTFRSIVAADIPLLASGTAGQYLTSNGTSAPTWTTGAGDPAGTAVAMAIALG